MWVHLQWSFPLGVEENIFFLQTPTIQKKKSLAPSVLGIEESTCLIWAFCLVFHVS